MNPEKIFTDLPQTIRASILSDVAAATSLAGKPVMPLDKFKEFMITLITDSIGKNGEWGDQEKKGMMIRLWRWCIATAQGGGIRLLEVQTIIDAVCGLLGLEPTMLAHGKQSKIITLGRELVSFVARRHTQLTVLQIAEAMGLASHNTVVWACKRIEEQLADPTFDRRLEIGGQTIYLRSCLEQVERLLAIEHLVPRKP